MRIAVVATAICLSMVGFATADNATAAMRKTTKIPPEGLGPALTALANQFDFQVFYRTEIVGALHTKGVSGEMTAREALEQVLTGTGLTYRYLDENTVTIVPVGSPSPQGENAEPPASGDDPSRASSLAQEGKKGNPRETRVAQLDQGTNSKPSAVDGSTSISQDGSKSSLTEIIVTAQKRNERLQDVPVPVTVINVDTFVESNQVQLQDYFTSVPGLSVTPFDIPGLPTLAIRGITTGPTNPTVAILVDDVPYGFSTSLGGGAPVPDIDPSDLDHVDVLRGPQGTLYVASSIGGILKYVTIDPSTAGVTGRAQANVESVYNGDGPGYAVRGEVNVPLGDTLAIRASGFARRDPGFIDDVLTGQRGVNWGDFQGGRLAALWRPSQNVSLKLSAVLQDGTVHGSSFADVEPRLGDLQQNVVRGIGGYTKISRVYSAILSVKLGISELTALSGYNTNSLTSSIDNTYGLGQATEAQFGVTGTPLFQDATVKKFSQEIRLSTPFGSKFEWLIGAFYTRETSAYVETLDAAVPTTGKIVGFWGSFNFPTSYAEYAAFTDLTFHVTDRFDIQVGGRESENRQTYSEVDTGPFVPEFEAFPSPLVFPLVVTHENDFTYLVTPRFKVSPDLMLYARVASGYRPGGPNPTATVYGLPASFNADKTQNYEIGAKGNVPGHAISFDASVYYIGWKDIQLSLFDPTNGFSYDSNGSRAKSQGVEVSVESKPLPGSTISGWVAFNDAVITEPFPPNSSVYGEPGERLPYSSRFSANLSLEQDFSVTRDFTAFFGGALDYVGNREGVFLATAERQIFPAYARLDLRAGVRYDDCTANLFVNNAADRRGVLTGGLGTVIPVAFEYIQPRTIGISVVKSFH